MPKERQFSRIDWGAISESFRQSARKHQQQHLGGDAGAASLRDPAKSQRKLGGESRSRSVKFDLDADVDVDAHEYEEDAKSSRPRCLLCALLLIAVVAAAIVCFVAIPSNAAISYWKAMSGSSNKELAVIDVVTQQGQEMLERAELITAACGKSSPLRRRMRSLGSDSTGTAGTGSSSCQALCQNHMCCVVQDEEYSCKNDEKKECAVYAGCEALIKDNLW